MNKQFTSIFYPTQTISAFSLVVIWCLLLVSVPSVFGQSVALDSCDNVTDPGQIGYDQILCAPGNDPAPIQSVRPASGGSGILEYVWMYSESDRVFNESTFRPIPNSNSETYDPGPLFRTTVFARCVRRVGCPNFLEPEVVVITVRNEARADIIGPTVVCFSDTITYTVETNTENPDDIQWTIPNGVNVLENTGKTITVTLSTFGQYDLQVMVRENGCTATGKKRIVAVTNPQYCGVEKDPVLANFHYSSDCGSTTVRFTNKSEGAERYLWTFFTAEGEVDPTSTDENPSFDFPQPGMFPVQLIAVGASGVQDTVLKVVEVGFGFVTPDFSYQYEGCGFEGIDVRLADNTQSSSSITQWNWQSSDGQTSSLSNPVFRFQEEGVVAVTLTVDTEEGCVDSVSKMVMIVFPDSLVNNLPDTVVNCPGESFQLQLIENMQYQYSWSPTRGIDNPMSLRPVFSPEETTRYKLTAGILGTTCTVVDSFLIIVPEAINLTVTGQEEACSLDRTLQAVTDISASVVWLSEEGDTLAEGLTYQPPSDTAFNLLVRAVSEEGCIEDVVIFYESTPIGVNLPDTLVFCPGDDREIFAEATGKNLMFRWEPSGAFTQGSVPHSIIFEAEPGEYEVVLTVRNPQGCEATDTALVVVIGEDFNLGFTAEPDTCANGGVQFFNQSTTGYSYSWDFGDPDRSDDTSTLANPSYQYREAGTYTITLTLEYGAACIDTIRQTLTIEPFAIQVDFSQEQLSCTREKGAVYQFEDLTVPSNDIASRYWTVSGGRDPILGESLTLSFMETGLYTVTLTVIAQNNCSYEKSVTLDVRIPPLNLVDTLLVCDGEGALLRDSQPTDSLFSFVWLPDEGLDNPLSPSPFANPGITTLYQVEVTGNGTNTCTLSDSTFLIVTDSIDLVTTPDTVICIDSVRLSARSSFPVNYQWFDADNNLIGSGPSVVVYPEGTESFTVLASTPKGGCLATRDIVVTNGRVDVVVTPESDTLVACPGDVVYLEVTNNRPDQELTYDWVPSDLLLSEIDTSSPAFQVMEEEYTIVAQVANELGCSETITRFVRPGLITLNLPDTVVACTGEAIELAPTANPDYFYTWFPPEGLSESNVNNPIFSGDTTTTYTVSVTENTSGLGCSITKEVVVLVGDSLDVRPRTILPGQICTGDTLALEVAVLPVQEEVDIVWYRNAELTDSVGAGMVLEVVVEEGLNIYFAQATNGRLCTGLVRYTFLGSDPGCSLPYVDTLCVGQPAAVDLICDPDAEGFLVFDWSSDLELDLSDPGQPIAKLSRSRLYEVTVTDSRNGCTQMGFVDLQIFPQGKIDLGQDTSICAVGDFQVEATISGLAPEDIDWYSAEEPGVVLGTGTTLTIPVMDTIVLIAKGVTADGCSVSDSITISVGDFVVPLADTINACPGEPIEINPVGVPSLLYNWSPDAALDLNTPWNPTAVLNNDQTYRVTISDPIRGCTVADSVVVLVQDTSFLTAGPDFAICGPEVVKLKASALCVDNIQWKNTQDSIIGEGLGIEVLPESGVNVYVVMGIGLSGEMLMDTVEVVRTDVVFVLPDTVLVCLNTPTPLNPEESGAGFGFRWSPITGLDNPMSSNPIAQITEDKLYRVTVTDLESGCTTEDSVYARVQKEPFVDAGPDLTVCADEEVSITAQLECVGLVNWTNDSGELIAVGAELTITPLEKMNTYIVSALSSQGDVVSDTVLVNVVGEAPVLPDKVLICANEPTPLHPSGDTSYSYIWSPARGLDNPNLANPTATLINDQDYLVTSTDTNGCVFTDTVRVDIRDGLAPGGKSSDTLLCASEAIVLFVTPDSGSVVEWYADAGLTELLATGTVYGAQPTVGRNPYYLNIIDTVCQETYLDSIVVRVENFMVSFGDTIQTCSNEPIALHPDPGTENYTYRWLPIEFLDNPNIPNPTATVGSDQWFEVIVTDPESGCTYFDSVLVDVQEQPLVNAGDDVTACVDDQVTLLAEAICAERIFWTDATGMRIADGFSVSLTVLSGSATYIVTAVSANGNSASDTVQVTGVGIPPSLPDQVLVCPDQPTPLNPNPPLEYTYQWAPSTGLSDPSAANPLASLTEDQEYTVITTDNNGCVFTDQVLVLVRNGLESDDKSSDTTLCSPEQLRLFTQPDSGVVITWYADADFQNELGGENTLLVNVDTGRNVFYILGEDPVCGTQFSDSIVVDVLSFTVSLQDTILACSGEPTPLNPQEIGLNYTFEWSPALGLHAPGAVNPLATLTQDQEYTALITDPVTGCTTEETVAVLVQTEPFVHAGDDRIVCPGERVDLVAEVLCANDIFWTDLTGNILGNGTTLTVRPPAGKNAYVVTATSLSGESASDTVQVEVLLGQPPGYRDTVYLCPGQPGSINPLASTDYTYQWSPTSSLNDPFASNPLATLTMDQQYSVTATDANGCTYVDSIWVNVRNGLDPGTITTDTTICGSELITLLAKADSGVIITWFSDLTLTDTLAQGEHYDALPGIGLNVYYVQGRDPLCGLTFLDSIRVEVVDFSVMLPDTVNVCQNEPTALNPNPAFPEFLYNWIPANGLDDPTSENPMATLARNQIYTVQITDPKTACTGTDTVQVVVQDEPTIDAGEDLMVCPGDSVILRATATCAQFVEWLTEEGVSLGMGTDITVVPKFGENIYIASAISSSGGIATDTVIVMATGTPPNYADGVQVCRGVPGAINPDPDQGYTYQWAPANVLDDANSANPLATLSEETQFTVISTDENGCTYTDTILIGLRSDISIDGISSDTIICEGDVVSLRVLTSSDYKIEWSNVAGEWLGDGVEIEVQPQPGNNLYFVTVTDSICATSTIDSVRISVPVFTDAIPPDTVISCGGDPVGLNLGASVDYGYSWDPPQFLDSSSIANPVATVSQGTWFEVTITDPSGRCSYIDSTFVEVQPYPDIDIPVDTLICLSEAVTLTARAEGSLGWEWSEDRNFEEIIGSEAALMINPEQGERVFYLRATNTQSGCRAVDSILVSFRPVLAVLEQLNVACEDGDALSVSVVNQDPVQVLSYLWSPENLIVGGDPTAGPTVSYTVEGKVRAAVMLSNQFGCNALLETTLEPLNLNDTIELIVGDTLLLPDEMTTATVTGCEDCTYEWYLDSILVEGVNGPSLEVDPDATTEVAVVTFKDGCASDTLRQLVVVNACVPPYVFVPSGFTPNGDGMNDFVRVFGEVILEEDFEFRIVDRWGSEVYFSTNKDDSGWDGTFMGRELPPDTYAYFLQYRCAVDEQLYFLKGNITIIR